MKSYHQTVAAEQRKRYSVYQKLAFLYALNLSDWLCTRALLSSGRFYEANPLMSTVLQSFLPTLLIKGILPLGLAVLCAVLYKFAQIADDRFTAVLMNTGIIIYSLVNLWHIVNFLLLFTAK